MLCAVPERCCSNRAEGLFGSQVRVMLSNPRKAQLRKSGTPIASSGLGPSILRHHRPLAHATKWEVAHPDLLFLAFLVFLAFFLFKEFLAILSVFPSFPRILGVRQAEEILAFLVVFLAAFQKGKEKKIRANSVVFQNSLGPNMYTHLANRHFRSLRMTTSS